jgi:RNA polymerase sigma-70 factor (ECF subfamily)
MRLQPSNQEIVHGLRTRNPEVLTGLVRVYGDPLSRYLTVLTGNHATAEDISQETWMHVLERGDQYNGLYRFQAWLYAIGHNLAVDHFRQAKPLSLEAMASAKLPFGPSGADYASPLEQVCFEEQRGRLRDQIRRLPRRHREVLLLRLNGGLSLAEIATVTKTPLSTVKRRLYDGISLLHKQLSPATRHGRRSHIAQRPECLSAA